MRAPVRAGKIAKAGRARRGGLATRRAGRRAGGRRRAGGGRIGILMELLRGSLGMPLSTGRCVPDGRR